MRQTRNVDFFLTYTQPPSLTLVRIDPRLYLTFLSPLLIGVRSLEPSCEE